MGDDDGVGVEDDEVKDCHIRLRPSMYVIPKWQYVLKTSSYPTPIGYPGERSEYFWLLWRAV